MVEAEQVTEGEPEPVGPRLYEFDERGLGETETLEDTETLDDVDGQRDGEVVELEHLLGVAVAQDETQNVGENVDATVPERDTVSVTDRVCVLVTVEVGEMSNMVPVG